MNIIELHKVERLRGEVVPPPDKSISHRAVIFSSMAKGKSVITNFLRAEDTMSTVNAFRKLGVDIREEAASSSARVNIVISGKGIHGLVEPDDVIDCGNSGTTMRLLSGVLAGNPFFSVLTGDGSLRSRPMQRITAPLGKMGAQISGRDGGRYAPIAILGGRLAPIRYLLPVASAQVKSALLLAGLYAEGETEITEPVGSRDHTERMLPAFGASIRVDGPAVKIMGAGELSGRDTVVPGDFSSAAFFMVAGLLIKDSEIGLRSVGINPTRTGLIDVLKRMGAGITIENTREVSGEPVADIFCKGGSGLKAVRVGREEMPLLIDEFPILCIAASQAEGITTIEGGEELRVKESDRIKAMSAGLGKMGVELQETPDGISIKGRSALRGSVVESYGDHRIAMSFAVAGLLADGETIIKNSSCVDISFPGFFEELKRLASN